jgi:hypothetical protein
LFRRTRLLAIWVAVVFHLAIELSASVEVFSYAALAALTVWVTPSTRDRIVRLRMDSVAGRRCGTVLRFGDWFARFRTEAAGPHDPDVTVVDRDGTVVTGPDATRFVLTRLPPTFPFAAPFRVVRRLGSVPTPM